MLERVLVIRHVVVVVVGIGEETVASGEDIACADVGRRKMRLMRLLDDKEVLVVVGEILAELIAEIGIGVAVANNLHGLARAHRTVVGGDYHTVVTASEQLEKLGDCRMAKPTEGDTAISRLSVCQLTHHLRLGARMTQHVDEIEHHNIDVVIRQLGITLEITLGRCNVVDFVIREGVVTAESLNLRAYERFLIDILALIRVLIHPKVGEHALDVIWHKSAEQGIAGILGGCGKNAAIELLVDVETVGKL